MIRLCVLTLRYLQQPSFIWESGIWGAVLLPPDVIAIESVTRKHLRLSAGDYISATFFAEGAFNKLYAITVSNSGSPQYIFRATPPVEPFFKTASEVATLSYLLEHTSIPVPRIFAHSSTSDNELGCEWTLMEKVPGVPLADVWSDIDLETKVRVTRSVAGYVRQLQDLRRRFTAIGNLYFREESDTFNPAVSGGFLKRLLSRLTKDNGEPSGSKFPKVSVKLSSMGISTCQTSRVDAMTSLKRGAIFSLIESLRMLTFLVPSISIVKAPVSPRMQQLSERDMVKDAQWCDKNVTAETTNAT